MVISALQHKSKFYFDLFKKKGFHVVSTREDLSIDASISIVVHTDIDEAMVSYFLGVRTDRHVYGILIWKHVGIQRISTPSLALAVNRINIPVNENS